ncbi:23454_t:CDS:1 [Racocetra persica]|uniref:23454_t:CDS:1 n=1 Tax=Racocetra persica TaxID=160502 RepID=A0ACA9QJ59_9GLOM|nr:23454_t:CDS:1 [Racocetra persica]
MARVRRNRRNHQRNMANLAPNMIATPNFAIATPNFAIPNLSTIRLHADLSNGVSNLFEPETATNQSNNPQEQLGLVKDFLSGIELSFTN